MIDRKKGCGDESSAAFLGISGCFFYCFSVTEIRDTRFIVSMTAVIRSRTNTPTPSSSREAAQATFMRAKPPDDS